MVLAVVSKDGDVMPSHSLQQGLWANSKVYNETLALY